MLTNQEKIAIIQERLTAVSTSYVILSDAITSYPNNDDSGHTPREDVLVDLERVISTLQTEIGQLNE